MFYIYLTFGPSSPSKPLSPIGPASPWAEDERIDKLRDSVRLDHDQDSIVASRRKLRRRVPNRHLSLPGFLSLLSVQALRPLLAVRDRLDHPAQIQDRRVVLGHGDARGLQVSLSFALASQQCFSLFLPPPPHGAHALLLVS